MSNGKTGKQTPDVVLRVKNPRMAKTARLVIESCGKKSVSRAMKEAGYAKASAVNPQNLTRSKTWNELMEQYLPDDKLLSKHNEALEATKWNEFTGEIVPDHVTRLRSVDLGYKIKNRFPAKKFDVNERVELVNIVKYGEPTKIDNTSV